MYAIVDIDGRQHKVEEGRHIFTQKLTGVAGDKVEFDNVLLTDNDGSVSIGVPFVKGKKVTGKILEHLRGDKVIVFKKKRRKGYKVRNGHRQNYTKVMIENIS